MMCLLHDGFLSLPENHPTLNGLVQRGPINWTDWNAIQFPDQPIKKREQTELGITPVKVAHDSIEVFEIHFRDFYCLPQLPDCRSQPVEFIDGRPAIK
jgi:hypothetical protein